MKDEYLARWLRRADRDLRVAENELHTVTGDAVAEAVCFHAQQAVEKYLKAYLVARQTRFSGRTTWNSSRSCAAVVTRTSHRWN